MSFWLIRTCITADKLYGVILCFNSSLQLLHLFRRLLQLCFTVTLKNCSVDYDSSPDSTSSWREKINNFSLRIKHFLVVINYKVRWRTERQHYFVFTYHEPAVSPWDGLLCLVLVHLSQSDRTLLGKQVLHLDFLLQRVTTVSLKDSTVSTVDYSKEHFKHFCFYSPGSVLAIGFLSVENIAKNDRVRWGGYVTWCGNSLAEHLGVEEEKSVN